MGETAHTREAMRTYLRHEKHLHHHVPDAVVDYLIALERQIHQKGESHGQNTCIR